jgi:hypothetical protein
MAITASFYCSLESLEGPQSSSLREKHIDVVVLIARHRKYNSVPKRLPTEKGMTRQHCGLPTHPPFWTIYFFLLVIGKLKVVY